jgi:multidrug transporter EmrE-like cation transporter
MIHGGGLPLFNIVPLGFGALMASIDASMLSFIKTIHLQKIQIGWILLPMLIYSLQPVLFYMSLQYETLTVMNLLWDVVSDVLITLIGLFIFQEKIGPYKKLGVILSLFSIVLLSLNDGF